MWQPVLRQIKKAHRSKGARGQKPAAGNDVSNANDGAGSDGAHEFSDFVTISSDERSNAILVYGTKRI